MVDPKTPQSDITSPEITITPGELTPEDAKAGYSWPLNVSIKPAAFSDACAMVPIEGSRDLDPNLYERLKKMIADNPEFAQKVKPDNLRHVFPESVNKIVAGGFRRGEMVAYSGSFFRMHQPDDYLRKFLEEPILINLETGEYTDAGREQVLTLVRGKARELGVNEKAMQVMYDSESFVSGKLFGKGSLIVGVSHLRITKDKLRYGMPVKRVGRHLAATTKRGPNKSQLKLGKFRKLR